MSNKKNIIGLTVVSLAVSSVVMTSALAASVGFNSNLTGLSQLNQIGHNQKDTAKAVNRVANILKANTYTQIKQDYLGLPDAQKVIDNAKSFVIGMNGLNNVGDIFSVASSIKSSLDYFHDAFVPKVYSTDKLKPKAKPEPVATPVSGAKPYSYASIYIDKKPGSMGGSFPGLPGFVMMAGDELSSNLCTSVDNTGQKAVLNAWCNLYKTAEIQRKNNLKSLLYTNITQPSTEGNAKYKQEAKAFISALMTDQIFNNNLLGSNLSSALKDFRSQVTDKIRGGTPEQKKTVYQQIAQLSTDSTIAQYIVSMKSVLAMKSMLLTYFDHLIAMNIKLKDGKPSTDSTAKSPNQLLKSMAVTPLSHVDQINTASPATISRMTLLALQRNNYLLYQLHQDMTRQSGLIAIEDVSMVKSGMMSQMMAQQTIKTKVDAATTAIKGGSSSNDEESESSGSSDTLSQDSKSKKAKAAKEAIEKAKKKAKEDAKNKK